MIYAFKQRLTSDKKHLSSVLFHRVTALAVYASCHFQTENVEKSSGNALWRRYILGHPGSTNLPLSECVLDGKVIPSDIGKFRVKGASTTDPKRFSHNLGRKKSTLEFSH